MYVCFPSATTFSLNEVLYRCWKKDVSVSVCPPPIGLITCDFNGVIEHKGMFCFLTNMRSDFRGGGSGTPGKRVEKAFLKFMRLNHRIKQPVCETDIG